MENYNLLIEIEKLEQIIQNTDIPNKITLTPEWSGAGVIIRKKMDSSIEDWLKTQHLVISFESNEPKRRAVITEHARELSWLFNELKQIFKSRIDYVSKYDFYGLLAQAAINYLESNKEHKEVKPLLLEVLNISKGFIKNESSN